MNVTNIVAANVKAIRDQRKLTLDGAAEITGVSRSMLSQIEKGDVNATISVLWKIANGYKVSFSSLIENAQMAPIDVIRHRDTQPLTEDDGRYVNYPVFAFDEQKRFESYRIVIKAGGQLVARPHLRGAEEYITVFLGNVQIRVDEAVHRLEAGDSIRFLADVPHAYENIGPGDAQLSLLIYYNP